MSEKHILDFIEESISDMTNHILYKIIWDTFKIKNTAVELNYEIKQDEEAYKKIRNLFPAADSVFYNISIILLSNEIFRGEFEKITR